MWRQFIKVDILSETPFSDIVTFILYYLVLNHYQRSLRKQVGDHI